MYFVPSGNTEFDVIWHAAWLSQNNFIGDRVMMSKSPSNYFIQIILFVVIAWYSASALDLATIFYFLLFHMTIFSPTNMQ
jgi:hypothetical protein